MKRGERVEVVVSVRHKGKKGTVAFDYESVGGPAVYVTLDGHEKEPARGFHIRSLVLLSAVGEAHEILKKVRDV